MLASGRDSGRLANPEIDGVLPRGQSTLIFVECSVSSALRSMSSDPRRAYIQVRFSTLIGAGRRISLGAIPIRKGTESNVEPFDLVLNRKPTKPAWYLIRRTVS